MNNIEHYASLADDGWGQIYYNVIPSIINKFDLKIIAEVGVAFGGHLEKILNTTNIEKAYGIDPYILFETSTDGFSFDQAMYDELFKFTENRLSKFKDKITLLREPSIIGANKIQDNSLDIVFIDAEHTFDGVSNDLKIWSQKVKTNGIISGHDYNHPNFPGVKLAVDQWVKDNNHILNIEDGYVWWVKK